MFKLPKNTAHLPTPYGIFVIFVPHDNAALNAPVVLVNPEHTTSGKPPLVRIHSECFTGDVMGSLRCDCADQLQQALELIGNEGGVLIYLRQEGRGIGLANKLKTYQLQERGLDTVEAQVKLHFPIDNRDYREAAEILKELNINHIRLLTNNTHKAQDLKKHGIGKVDCVPLEVTPNNYNRRYIETKKAKLGHIYKSFQKISREDIEFMHRALELAKRGEGFVSPNPLVGAVLVKNNKIIGEGWHEHFSEAHAEVNAINNAKKNKQDAENGTIYVTLEPCNHFGHTPPCTLNILRAGIKRVVFAAPDPNPHVNGNGATKLRRSGLIVDSGVLEKEAKEQNKIFFHWITTGLPYVTVKVGISQDNKITKTIGAPTQISDPNAQRFVHHLRETHDAILVGAETVHTDDPMLSVRFSNNRAPPQPLRVILDGKLSIDPKAKVLRDTNCIIFTTKKALASKLKTLQKKVPVVVLPDKNGKVAIKNMSNELAYRRITSVLVEGGQNVLQQFFESEIVNDWLLVRSREIFGRGLNFIDKPNRFTQKLSLQKKEKIGNDVIEYYRPH